jgi:hypothetical protein
MSDNIRMNLNVRAQWQIGQYGNEHIVKLMDVKTSGILQPV